jgi:molybdopterin molybdotransferase
VAEVWRLIDEQVGALEAVAAPLGEALGRVLRRDVLADADQPPFDRAAMDGYAFFPAAGPARYRLVGAIKAGETASSVPGPDEAVRIFTGAALPATGMAVLMQEEARVEDGMLAVERRVEPGEQVRRRATEARTGDVLVRAGTRLGPAEVAIAAAVGETRPLVTRWPRVAHATTGDEIVPPEKTPGPGQIRDSNGVLIAALLGATGLPPGCLTQERWGDDATAATERMRAEAFAKAEVVLISGGASVGEHDYAARVLGAAGFELRVRRVNSRPGRPLIFGTNGRRLAFGLPGNPVSHFVCFHLFVHRALARLAGAEPVAWGTARLAVALEEAANARPTYWPAVRGWDAEGRMTVRPLPWCSSGHLAALAGADALFLVPPHTETLPAGAQVDTLPLTTPAPS